MGVGGARRSNAGPCDGIANLDLDLEVFQGPFDLLLTLVLKEEVDLLEVDLAEVVLSYVDHLEQKGELDLEAATEFLVLIAALLELKSQLMLPASRRRAWTSSRRRPPRSCSPGCSSTTATAAPPAHARAAGGRARLPLSVRSAAARAAPRIARGCEAAYEPEQLAEALGDSCPPPPLDLGHMRGRRVSVEKRLRTCATCSPARRSRSTRRCGGPTG